MDDLFLDITKDSLDICVLSFATDNMLPSVEPVFKNNEEYCLKHGYAWRRYSKLKDESRPPHWSKIKYILQELNNGFDWVFWIDADAIIMNHSIKLESFINNDFDFIITNTAAGWCTGAWLINNNDYSKELLEYTYTKEEYINHPCGLQIDPAINNAAHERGARVKVLKQTKMNSFPHEEYYTKFNEYTVEAGVFKFKVTYDSFKENRFTDGDFVLHMAGFNGHGRVEIFKNYKERIIK